MLKQSGLPSSRWNASLFPALPAICCLASVALPGQVTAFEWGTVHARLSTGFEQLGYQEHLDPNIERESRFATCVVDGETRPCFIDSDATSNALLIQGGVRVVRATMPRWRGEISFRGQLARGTSQERWRAAASENGTRGTTGLLQTDDLDYRWFALDLIAGHAFADLVQPVIGWRLSRAEQFRDRFRRGDGSSFPGVVEATEPIDSSWLLLGLVGERGFSRTVFHYDFKVALPLSVTTTNSLFEGIEFTGVDGHAIEAAGVFGFPLRPGLLFTIGLGGGVMHWNGSDVVPGQGFSALWPRNDTQRLAVTTGIELVR